MTDRHMCPSCGHETQCKVLSGGTEWYCPGCETDGSYPEPAADHCFVCDGELTLNWDGDPTQYDGTRFIATGNYGSGVWDPMSNRLSLEIHICDDCMRKRSNRAVVIHKHVPTPTYTRTRWYPGNGIE